ncbi:hypothetical protein TorRG33x02_337910, partial [Trema orientale]
ISLINSLISPLLQPLNQAISGHLKDAQPARHHLPLTPSPSSSSEPPHPTWRSEGVGIRLPRVEGSHPSRKLDFPRPAPSFSGLQPPRDATPPRKWNSMVMSISHFEALLETSFFKVSLREFQNDRPSIQLTNESFFEHR